MPDLGLDIPRPGSNLAGLERFLKEYGMDSKRVAPSQMTGGAGQGEAGMRRLALERHPQVVAASLAVAEAEARKARVELLRLCGLRAAAPSKLSVAPPQRQELDEDFESLRKSALKSSDALGKARLAFRLADRRLALHLAEQWPDLTLGPAIVGDAGGVALGLAVGMEIPMLHQRGGQVEVARLQRDAAAEALRQQARDLTARLDASFIELDALKAELDGLLKEAAGELDQATVLAEVRYASGRLDVLRLLGVHRAFANLKLEYLELLHAQRITLIGLEAEVGRPLRLKSEEVSP